MIDKQRDKAEREPKLPLRSEKAPESEILADEELREISGGTAVPNHQKHSESPPPFQPF
jgi:hypothetical protein